MVAMFSYLFKTQKSSHWGNPQFPTWRTFCELLESADRITPRKSCNYIFGLVLIAQYETNLVVEPPTSIKPKQITDNSFNLLGELLKRSVSQNMLLKVFLKSIFLWLILSTDLAFLFKSIENVLKEGEKYPMGSSEDIWTVRLRENIWMAGLSVKGLKSERTPLALEGHVADCWVGDPALQPAFLWYFILLFQIR